MRYPEAPYPQRALGAEPFDSGPEHHVDDGRYSLLGLVGLAVVLLAFLGMAAVGVYALMRMAVAVAPFVREGKW